ncbi:type II toxin-antitoxin system RelE/ParE family toxin [Sinimarinibacterium flocculans]|uniref:Proteic killer suppression protein n=1 Tax=Sinimarinibacterium flocculans TaxID=985250 RepID=A0A318E942_9GAMM|nr:type II toxin-antitoxin system RelE/ParE family toxin [Sinimarinibacterium flocculans]PXV65810.1 proteic killer suppression protein [Sinimarinibacterium flocculans]
MIRSFRHRGLERFFTRSDYRGIPAQFAPRLERLLDRLDACARPEDMNLPGYKFHPLKGARKGAYAVSVSGNWRLTFEFDGEDAVVVDLEDYH